MNINLDRARLSSDNNFGITCPVCGDTSSGSLLCEIDSYDVYTCHRCNVEYVFPVPDDCMLKAYYDRKDWFEGGEKGGYQDYDAQTEWSLNLFRSTLDAYQNPKGLSILDIGCGYGTHLAIASERGWKCFGVELSDHAREIAKSRLGNSAYVVESISDLIPHEFDLIVILDVIEHLHSPYLLFYELFSIGAITPKTKIVITTPNAGSIEAKRDPKGWAYRHPPSHLIFYTQESLSYLFRRLQFSDVSIQGLHPIADTFQAETIDSYAGLIAYASSSDFTEFMRERYVPGTWSKLAEYEHMPRYRLACKLAPDKQVLDFGCGTGYGSAMLAEIADSVTGLDIDSKAQIWARDCHHNPNLNFHQCDDLGATFAPRSFDLVTCFEMIEHVDQATQKATVASIARLLRDDGILIISTPNPDVTKLYGDNPYHLREMTEREFLELLSEHFSHITILKQKVRIGVSFDGSDNDEVHHWSSEKPIACSKPVEPIAFIAICSKKINVDISPFISFDDTDYILEFVKREKKLHQIRFEAYSLAEEFSQQVKALQSEMNSAQLHINRQTGELDSYRSQAKEFSQQVKALQSEMNSAQLHINYQTGELAVFGEKMAAKESAVKELNQTLADRDHLIAAMQSSIGWIVTKPIRVMVKLVSRLWK